MRLLLVVSIAAAAGLTLSLNTSAADWKQFSKSDEAFHSVDHDSIAPRGKYMRAWVMVDYFKPKKLTAYPNKEYLSSKALWAFDCVEKTITSIQDIAYAGDTGVGEIVESTSVDWEKARFRDVVPDSMGEAVMQIVCKRKPQIKPAAAKAVPK